MKSTNVRYDVGDSGKMQNLTFKLHTYMYATSAALQHASRTDYLFNAIYYERVNFVLGKWQDFKFNVEDMENKQKKSNI